MVVPAATIVVASPPVSIDCVIGATLGGEPGLGKIEPPPASLPTNARIIESPPRIEAGTAVA
jgi:hypothetical protein